MDLQAYVFALTLILGVGVAMLERTITRRRPEYAEYICRTNAFFPGLPKRPSAVLKENAS